MTYTRENANIPHLGRNAGVISVAFEPIFRTVNNCRTCSIIMIQHHSNWAQTNLQQFNLQVVWKELQGLFFELKKQLILHYPIKLYRHWLLVTGK
jgi:hypothetical protein